MESFGGDSVSTGMKGWLTSLFYVCPQVYEEGEARVLFEPYCCRYRFCSLDEHFVYGGRFCL